ncbi:methylglyoxal synthase [Rhizobiaceae bacterium CRRU44]|uniref:Methylglyoxal synthase n=1 Tax=Ferranicluibacter rubi TaxID=2715133 RepID=A0AA43ZD02_9HYPH|nr:methylglyoxal synthase [Ferranicluibacter rubi]NHT74753.1 methylglyoxal synthase [Ferranicluibacter rubi]
MTARKCMALIAHDLKKQDMAEFAKAHESVLADWWIVATGTTGGRVQEACPGLDVTRLKSGPLGGDQQIGALIATGDVDLLIFFIDPLTALPHDVDVKALTRLATVYDIPMALNRATAERLVDFRPLSAPGAVTVCQG